MGKGSNCTKSVTSSQNDRADRKNAFGKTVTRKNTLLYDNICWEFHSLTRIMQNKFG